MMMSQPHNSPRPAESRPKRPWQQFAIGMILYAVTVVAQGFFLRPLSLHPALMLPLALAPMLFVFWAMLGWLEAVRRYDELQRRIQIEAALWSLGLTGMLTFSYGFLEVYLALPRPSMFFVWPLIALTYCLGVYLAKRRYG